MTLMRSACPPRVRFPSAATGKAKHSTQTQNLFIWALYQAASRALAKAPMLKLAAQLP